MKSLMKDIALLLLVGRHTYHGICSKFILLVQCFSKHSVFTVGDRKAGKKDL